jgi:hypothetical protein
MTQLSMSRNGYFRLRDGRFTKTVEFPNGKEPGNGINHYVETIIRSPSGRLLGVKTQNTRR